jgi:hypothetical protein
LSSTSCWESFGRSGTRFPDSNHNPHLWKLKLTHYQGYQGYQGGLAE